MNSYLKKHWPDIAVIVTSLFLCLLVFINVVPKRDTLAWDPAHHTLYGTMIANDIKTGDWERFWDDTHRQTLWPFIQSWYLGLFFTIFGISYISARASHLVLFFFILLTTWFTGRSLDEKRGPAIGGIAFALFLFSSFSWIFSTEVSIEIPAALITICIFYSLLMLEKSKKWLWIAPLSILMAMIMVTKYNHAMNIYVSVLIWGLYQLISVFTQPMRVIANKKTNISRMDIIKKDIWNLFLKYSLIFAPTVFTFFWWMFGPYSEKKWFMIDYSQKVWASQTALVPGFMNNFLYYFQHLVNTYTWIPALGILTIVGIIGFFYYSKERSTPSLLLLIFVWANMPIIIWVFMTKAERYIFPMLPLIYLTAAFFWVLAWENIKDLPAIKKYKILNWALALIMTLILFHSLPIINYFSGRSHIKAPGEKYMDVLDYFAKTIPPDAPVACGSECVNISPYDFGFHFNHHLKDRTAPSFDKYSIGYAKFSPGMYLVAYMQDPTPEKMKEDQWYKMINANLANLRHIDSKYFSFLKIKTDIYQIK